MTSTITPTTGTITSAGIGSGLDVTSIISSLMAVESLPLNALQSKATTLQTDLSTFGQVQSLAASLQDAAKALVDPTSFNQTVTSSSDASSASAATTSGAVPGSYSISVSALSAGQSIVSPTGQYTDATSAVGTGSVTIQLGSWNDDRTAFTAGAASAITIPIGATSNTLAGVAAAINAANAGVSATVVTDATGARLALQSTASGVANGFRVTTADSDGTNTDGAGLSRLAYDPANGASQMTLAQSAANTKATINGIPVTSAGNTLSGVIGGITFSVGKTTTQPVTINVTPDTSTIKTNVTSFVSAFNALNSFLATETKYDASTGIAAPLQGDSTAVSIQNQMHALVSHTSGASSAFSTLSSLGIQLQADGSLQLSGPAFTSALSNLPTLTKALSNVDPTTPANNGFGKIFSNWTTSLLGSGGTLDGKATSIKSSITKNQKDQQALNTQLAATQARLKAQYTALDSTMSKATALAAYVQQQFYAKTNSNSN